MYFQNGNYMQDLNYYNQSPNYGYNPYMANNYPNMNTQMPMGQMPQANLSAMYPAVYRIISPVASQVLSNNSSNYLTEECLNNMVDTVYNIVESDINLANNSNPVSQSTTVSENSNNSNCDRNSARPSTTTTSTTTSMSNRQNSLLRDLIRIIILNEIISRRQNNQSMMMNNNMMAGNRNQPMFL